MTTTNASPESTHRHTQALVLVGTVGVGAGLLGAAHALLLAAYPATVAEGSYSFPLPPAGFVVSQGFLVARDLALALLLTGLQWTPATGGRLGRLGLVAGAISMLALAALEIVSVALGDSVDPGAWYGLASFGAGLGLTLAGAAAARTSIRPRWRRYLPLATGLYVFAVLTPGILAGFTLGQLAIGGWMLLFACLGKALLTSVRGSSALSSPTRGSAR